MLPTLFNSLSLLCLVKFPTEEMGACNGLIFSNL